VFCVNSRVKKEINSIGNLILPFSAARFLLPATELTRYDTLVETVYSSFDDGILGCVPDCGAATRLDFDDAAVCCSDFLLTGSEDGSLEGSEEGSLDGSEECSLDGSDDGSEDGSLDGSEVGSLAGSDVGSLAGSAALSYPTS
jgi:hypothetical protein